MKKIVKMIILILSINVYSQPGVIVPLNTLAQDIQNGTYIKDINNEYLPYVGTWKGVLQGKEYTFSFQLFSKNLISYPSGTYYYRDLLKGKYEVKDIATGNVLFTTMSVVNYSDYYITALGLPNNGRLNFHYVDIGNCYNGLKFSLFNVLGTPNQLRYGGFNDRDFYIPENCPYTSRYDIPVTIPKSSLVLFKQ